MSSITLSNTQRTILAAAIEHTHGKIERFPQGLSGAALVISLEALERKGLAANDGQGHWIATPEGYKAMGRKHPDSVESLTAEAAKAHAALIDAVFEPEVASEPDVVSETETAAEPVVAIEPEVIATTADATVESETTEPEAIIESAGNIEQDAIAEAAATIEPDVAIEPDPSTESEPATKPKQLKVCPHCGHALTTPVTRTRESSKPCESSKQDLVVQMLKRPEGATIKQIMASTGWQSHSIRGFFSGGLKKKMGLTITSEKVDGLRTYRAE
ncbi:MAG: DUF3489 domain-containing protein [Pseudomonadota bacterium]